MSLMFFSTLFYGQVTLPFLEGFENVGSATNFGTNTASLNGLSSTDHAWSFEKTLAGRLRFDTGLGFEKSGNFAATMDDSILFGQNSINYLILTLDMSNYAVATDSVLMDFS